MDQMNADRGVTSHLASDAKLLKDKFQPLMMAGVVFMWIGIPLFIVVVPMAIAFGCYLAAFMMFRGTDILTGEYYKNSLFNTCDVDVDMYGVYGWDIMIALLFFLAISAIAPMIFFVLYQCCNCRPGSTMHPGHEDSPSINTVTEGNYNGSGAKVMSLYDADLAVGCTLEVDFDGCWVPARLEKKNPDGTVNVAFLDGNEEDFVTQDRLR